MISTADYDTLAGMTVKGTDGDKIGKVQDVYASTDDSTPTFVTVSTGMFGGKASFVPVAEATLTDDELVVPYTKDQVKDAPNLDSDEELTAEEEDRLYSHYSLTGHDHGTSGTTTDTAYAGAAGATAAGVSGDRTVVDEGSTYDSTTDMGTGARGAGHDTSGPDTDNAMTRSEEQLNVGVETRETGRARLVKHIVTEQEQVSVPVSREEVRVVREPVTEANAGAANVGGDLTEEEHEVVLTEQVPVVTTETHPVERVRLETETVTDEQTVSGEVRKEVIETEGARDRNDS